MNYRCCYVRESKSQPSKCGIGLFHISKTEAVEDGRGTGREEARIHQCVWRSTHWTQIEVPYKCWIRKSYFLWLLLHQDVKINWSGNEHGWLYQSKNAYKSWMPYWHLINLHSLIARQEPNRGNVILNQAICTPANSFFFFFW